MTIKTAKAIAREFGCSLNRTPFDEFRVNLRGRSEDTASYTNDLTDAVQTAQAMSEVALAAAVAALAVGL